MTEFIKKNTKIINTVLMYFMEKKCGKISIDIESNDEAVTIIFDIDDVHVSREDLDDMRYSLNIPYQDDVDEYYWQLNGLSDKEVNFDLIGMMINEHEIEYKDRKMHIELVKQK